MTCLDESCFVLANDSVELQNGAETPQVEALCWTFNEASYEVLQKFIKNARCQVFTQWNQSQTYKGCKISIDTVSNLEELSIF